MKEPTGRIARATRYYGGGGGGSINVPSLGQETGSVVKGFNTQVQPAFNSFVQNQPLLQNMQQFGLEAAQGIEPYINSILQNPYSVPPELLNYATQGARGAFQARGNVGSGSAIAGELAAREQVRQQRIASAMGLAGQTEQLLGYPESAATGNFATLVNPLYGLAAAQLGAQTQGQIAQGQIGAENKGSQLGLAGSALSAIGSVAGAA